MPIIIQNISSLNQQSLVALQNNTKLTQVANGTVLQGIVSAVNTVIAGYYTDEQNDLSQVYLATATGSSLDLIGQMLGMPRGSSRIGIGTNAQQFYVISGNIGSLAGIGTLGNVIPAGTIISSEDSSIQYSVISAIPFSNTATSIFGSIKALTKGSSSNVGVNILTQHNLSVAGLLTTNIAAVNNGIDTQSDNNYRVALSQAVTAAEAGNQIAITLAALSTTGVSSILLIPYYYGVGTYTVIVIGTTPIIDQITLNNVLSTIQKVTSLGEYVTVQPPRYVGIEITGQLIFNPSVSTNDQQAIAKTVTNNLYDYINNIQIGNGIIRDQIIKQILNTDNRIQDIDDNPNSPTCMDIAVWTPTTIDIVNNIETANYIRTDLGSQDYVAQFDDKVIPMQNVNGYTLPLGYNPITINW